MKEAKRLELAAAASHLSDDVQVYDLKAIRYT